MNYTVQDFDYELPEGLIAQRPLAERPASRLLMLGRDSGAIRHQHFSDLETLLKPGDLLVLNNTRVIPARLYGEKETGGKVECLVERLLTANSVFAHIKASKAPKENALIYFAENVTARMLARHDDLFELEFNQTVLPMLEAQGELPLPPYITHTPDEEDRERYQTVFAKEQGAVAAPTAGLHFDKQLLEKLRARGIQTTELTLHVGAGTFQPVRVDEIANHKMHSEWIQVPQLLVDAVNETKANGGRVIAVGTTVVRSLETASRSGELKPFEGDTDIFITPGFEFQCIDGLITNFHLPKSTLMMLVSAFAGFDNIRKAYQEAVNERYRFFSYGDAMFITDL